MYQLNKSTWVRPEMVSRIEIPLGFDVGYVQTGNSAVQCSADEARALLEYLNGSYNDVKQSPAAPVVIGKQRIVTSVEKFISRSGNESWKAESAETLLYFRQVQREMLQDAGLWDELNEMHVGEVLPCEITVYTVPDGDLHKIVRIDPGGMFFDPEDDGDDWEDVEDEPEDVPMLGLDPKPIPETDDMPDDPFYSVIRSGNYVILDTETTGLDDRAEICQIAIIDSSGAVLLDTLVKPVQAIPSTATAIHGITNKMVQDAPNWLNVNERVWQALQGKTVVVYNADYDFRLLAQSEFACEPIAVTDWHTIKRECAMLKFAEVYGDWNSYRQSYRWQKLETAARHYMLPVEAAHSALGDCRMTLAVCKAMLAAKDARHEQGH